MANADKGRSRQKRLVCIVEGHGEVQAIPNLCARIFAHLGAKSWLVDQHPVKQPRSRLVDHRVGSPNRPPQSASFQAAIEMAVRRPGDAVLVLCDSDDDCPAAWGPAATLLVRRRVRGAAVMVLREYETWLLASCTRSSKIEGRKIEEIRDAKKLLSRYVPGYKPTVHQLSATRSLDIPVVRAISASFDKLVRCLAEIAEVEPGDRPLFG